MKVWITGKPGLEKYLGAIYERSDQAEGVKGKDQCMYSVEMNLENTLILVSGEESVEEIVEIIEEVEKPSVTATFTKSKPEPKLPKEPQTYSAKETQKAKSHRK